MVLRLSTKKSGITPGSINAGSVIFIDTDNNKIYIENEPPTNYANYDLVVTGKERDEDWKYTQNPISVKFSFSLNSQDRASNNNTYSLSLSTTEPELKEILTSTNGLLRNTIFTNNIDIEVNKIYTIPTVAEFDILINGEGLQKSPLKMNSDEKGKSYMVDRFFDCVTYKNPVFSEDSTITKPWKMELDDDLRCGF